MRARCLAPLFLAACGATAPPVEAPRPIVGEAATLVRCAAPDDESDPFVDLDACLTQRDDRAIAELLLEVTGAELRAIDPTPHFTEDAQWVFARASAPSPYEITLDPAAARARTEWLVESAGGPIEDESYRFSWASLELRREGDEAHFVGTHVELYGSHSSRHDVDAHLSRTSGGWRITRMREWPRSRRTADESETYDDAYWSARDQEAAAARAALEAAPTDPERRRALVERLLAAMRYGDAMETVGPLVESTPTVDDLQVLARLHGLFGRIAEAREAMARAQDAATRGENASRPETEGLGPTRRDP